MRHDEITKTILRGRCSFGNTGRIGFSLLELIVIIAVATIIATISVPRFAVSASAARGVSGATAIAAYFTNAVAAARVSGTPHAIVISESPPTLTTYSDPLGTPVMLSRLDLSRSPFGYEMLEFISDGSETSVLIGSYGTFGGRGVVLLDSVTSRSAVIFGYNPGLWSAYELNPAGAVDVSLRASRGSIQFADQVSTLAVTNPIQGGGNTLTDAQVSVLQTIVEVGP